MSNIRKATLDDISRIAEILVFSKRKNYRQYFKDDIGSFVGIQVYPLIKDYLDHPETLENYYLYDDDIVKGLIHIEGPEIKELYIDPFFEGQGIGGKLIKFAIQEHYCDNLWVIDQNLKAKQFYKRHGFQEANETKKFPGTDVLLAKMTRR